MGNGESTKLILTAAETTLKLFKQHLSGQA